MRRRQFIRTVAAGAAAMAAGQWIRNHARGQGATDERATTGPAPAFDLAASRRTLAEHRIARMETRRLQDRYPRAVGRNARSAGGAGRGGTYQVRTLITDKGARGWAMNHWKDDEVKEFVGAKVGDLFDPGAGTADEAMRIDTPLYDLAGHILGVPVSTLLGGRGPRTVPVYSGAIYFEDLEPPGNPLGVAAVIGACQQDHNAGYRAFKLKIGRGFKHMPREKGIARDVEVTRAVRERFPDCRVLVDANDGYTADDFIGYLKAVAECDLYWIEEPFTENRDDYRKLRDAMAAANCTALIADGEMRSDRAEAPWAYGGYSRAFIDRLYALAAEKLVDVFLFDLGIVGYTRWRRVMPDLVKAGVKASPHTWMWTPRPYYAAHLAAGCGNVVIVEGIPGRAEGIDYSAYRFEQGDLVVPEAPGFGLRLVP